MTAIHGGTATNDPIDAQKIAVLLRGGMLPQAYVYPADMRATRALRRRRIHLLRKRAERLTHVPQTNRQSTLPERGQQSADAATRDGVAERFPAPAVQQSLAVDLALLGPYAERLRALELAIVTTAKPHDANPRYVLQTVPGIGKMLRRGLWDAIHDRARCPRVQDFVSECRLVKCAKASAGNRSGTSGTKIGHAYLP